MIECDGIVMTGLVRVSAIGGSASDANRQIARSTAKRNNERRVDYGIDIRQRRRRARSSASCHARESGHLETFSQALDSRLRGMTTMIECDAIVLTGPARFRDWRLSVECEPADRSLDRESKQ
jgi:hypothetical protein